MVILHRPAATCTSFICLNLAVLSGLFLSAHVSFRSILCERAVMQLVFDVAVSVLIIVL